jgi:hypothetical protein
VRKHEPDVVSLVFGLFFVGAAAVWGLSDVPGHPVRGWALPVLLITVGAVGLLTSIAARHTRPPEPLVPAAPPAPPHPGDPFASADATGPADPTRPSDPFAPVDAAAPADAPWPSDPGPDRPS